MSENLIPLHKEYRQETDCAERIQELGSWAAFVLQRVPFGLPWTCKKDSLTTHIYRSALRGMTLPAGQIIKMSLQFPLRSPLHGQRQARSPLYVLHRDSANCFQRIWCFDGLFFDFSGGSDGTSRARPARPRRVAPAALPHSPGVP